MADLGSEVHDQCVQASMPQILSSVPGRRAPNRFGDSMCRTCQPGEVREIARTPMAVYYQCFACNSIWGEPKPFHVTVIRGVFRRRRTDRVTTPQP
jgi:hypothetical protein